MRRIFVLVNPNNDEIVASYDFDLLKEVLMDLYEEGSYTLFCRYLNETDWSVEDCVTFARRVARDNVGDYCFYSVPII